MTTYHVTSDFPVGTTGEVVLVRKEWLTSATEGLVPPEQYTDTLSGSPPSVDLTVRASEEDGVSPDFTYEVYIRLTGHNEMKGLLYVTGATDLGTAIQFTTPADPALFVTRAEYEADQEAAGNPASQGDLDALEAVVDQLAADLDTEETARATDVNLEEARATAAEGALDTRMDAEEAATASADGRLDALEAINTDSRLDAEEAATAAHDSRLDDIEDGTAIGRIINTDDEGTTIFIGVTSPTGQVTGDIWLDPTP